MDNDLSSEELEALKMTANGVKRGVKNAGIFEKRFDILPPLQRWVFLAIYVKGNV